jgi:hypothetical protein
LEVFPRVLEQMRERILLIYCHAAALTNWDRFVTVVIFVRNYVAVAASGAGVAGAYDEVLRPSAFHKLLQSTALAVRKFREPRFELF